MSNINYEFNDNNEVIVNSGGLPRVERPFDKEALYSLLDKMTTEQLDELIDDINDEKKLREFKVEQLKKFRSRMNRELKLYKQELENQKERIRMISEQQNDEDEEIQESKYKKKTANNRKK